MSEYVIRVPITNTTDPAKQLENYRELERRAARVVNEWHEDDLTADAVGFLAELVPPGLLFTDDDERQGEQG